MVELFDQIGRVYDSYCQCISDDHLTKSESSYQKANRLNYEVIEDEKTSRGRQKKDE